MRDHQGVCENGCATCKLPLVTDESVAKEHNESNPDHTVIFTRFGFRQLSCY